jgi:5-methyltetrahydrofolate--homocysteine methyltransferase
MKESAGEKDRLLEDANTLLSRVKKESLLSLRAVLGIFPIKKNGDDVIFDKLIDAKTPQSPAKFCFLRNQEQRPKGLPNVCLSDFLNEDDYLGLFALSAGFGLREAEAGFLKNNDEYNRLLLASLANSLAEAFAEELHCRVRREFWAYAPDEELSIADTLAGKYAGTRCAFGYPSCPDHQDKRTVFDILSAEQLGLTLTESAMISPESSVCGMYFSHPDAYYFSAGSIALDQMQDWANRKNITAEEAGKRLFGFVSETH